MSVLKEIVERKRERLKLAKESTPIERIRELALDARKKALPHRLRAALQSDGINIIAEFKRRSPSRGIIRDDVRATTMATSYQTGGASAISVLTEEDYFDGSLDDLRAIRSVVQLPVLRKDFLFDEFQIYEAAASGADAILLIVASLNDECLKSLREVTESQLGMDALVEVHDEVELKRAVNSGATLIGVNNRNLHTFEVSLNTSLQLARQAAPEATLISESGLYDAADLSLLRDAGFRGFLIGEALMRATDPEAALRALVNGR
jgi:indole-3-glycerol phosphate synthase